MISTIETGNVTACQVHYHFNVKFVFNLTFSFAGMSLVDTIFVCGKLNIVKSYKEFFWVMSCIGNLDFGEVNF